MDLFQAAVLGVLQGLTELLPISSSGHLIVVPWMFGWKAFDHNLTFDVALHLGTLLAIVAFFWSDLWDITGTFLTKALKDGKNIASDAKSRLFLMLVVGSIPAGLAGGLLDKYLEENLRSPLIVAFSLILVGVVLWFVEREAKQEKQMTEIRWRDTLLIGLAQTAALVPGVSRSGATITAGLFQGLDRATAARFSFLLATPVVAGAAIFKLKDFIHTGLPTDERNAFLVGIVAAAIAGWIAIKYLLSFVQNHSYRVFVWYRIILGLLIVGLTFFR
ncbi:MAG: undecaprenyl-diphosphatase UppP [Patescibacteria group bacterium]|nr:undecaprenyl-diphosphatase UppP [Patescibacteria group bacterium]